MSSNNNKAAADLKGGKINFDYITKNNMDIADLVKLARKNKGQEEEEDDSDSYYEEEIIEEEIVEDDLSLLASSRNNNKNKTAYQIPHFRRPNAPAKAAPKPKAAPAPAAKKKKEKKIDGSKLLLLQSAEQKLTDASRAFKDAIQEGAAIVNLLEFMLTNAEEWDVDDIDLVDGTAWETRKAFASTMDEAKDIIDRLESGKHKLMGTRNKGDKAPPTQTEERPESPESPTEDNKAYRPPLLAQFERQPSYRIPDLSTLAEGSEHGSENDSTQHNLNDSSDSAASIEEDILPPPPPSSAQKQIPTPTKKSDDELSKAKEEMMKFAEEGKKLASKLVSPDKAPKNDDMAKAKQAMMEFAKEGAALASKLEKSKDGTKKTTDTTAAAAAPAPALTPEEIKKKELEEAKKMFLEAATQGASLVASLETRVARRSITKTANNIDPKQEQPSSTEQPQKKQVDQADVDLAKSTFHKLAQQGAELVNKLEGKISKPKAGTTTEQSEMDASDRDKAAQKELTLAGDSFLETAKESAQLLANLQTQMDDDSSNDETISNNDKKNSSLTDQSASFLAVAQGGADLVTKLEKKIASGGAPPSETKAADAVEEPAAADAKEGAKEEANKSADEKANEPAPEEATKPSGEDAQPKESRPSYYSTQLHLKANAGKTTAEPSDPPQSVEEAPSKPVVDESDKRDDAESAKPAEEAAVKEAPTSAEEKTIEPPVAETAKPAEPDIPQQTDAAAKPDQNSDKQATEASKGTLATDIVEEKPQASVQDEGEPVEKPDPEGATVDEPAAAAAAPEAKPETLTDLSKEVEPEQADPEEKKEQDPSKEAPQEVPSTKEPEGEKSTQDEAMAVGETSKPADEKPVESQKESDAGAVDPEKELLYSDIGTLYDAGTQVEILEQMFDAADVATVVARARTAQEKDGAANEGGNESSEPQTGETADDKKGSEDKSPEEPKDSAGDKNDEAQGTENKIEEAIAPEKEVEEAKSPEVSADDVTAPVSNVSDQAAETNDSLPQVEATSATESGQPTEGAKETEAETNSTAPTPEAAKETPSDPPPQSEDKETAADLTTDTSHGEEDKPDTKPEPEGDKPDTPPETKTTEGAKSETAPDVVTESKESDTPQPEEAVESPNDDEDEERRASVRVSSAEILALRANATNSFESDDGDDDEDVPAAEVSKAAEDTVEDSAKTGENGNSDTVPQEEESKASDDSKDDSGATELDKARQSFLAAAQEGAALISQLEKKIEDDNEVDPDAKGGGTNGDDKKGGGDDDTEKEQFLAKARGSFLAAAKEGAALVALLEDKTQTEGAPTKDEKDVILAGKSFMDAALLVDKMDKSAYSKSGGKETEEEEEVEEEEVEDGVEAAKKAFLQFAKEGASLVSKLETKFKAEDDDEEEIIEEVIESDEEEDRAAALKAAKADFLSFSKGLDKKLPS